MGAMSKDDLIKAIDDMPIYRRDYAIIQDLLSKANISLMAKIIEEVIEGNLQWVDFERSLSDEYSEAVTDSIKIQRDIQRHYDLYMSLAAMLGDDEADYASTNMGSMIALRTGNASDSDADREFVNKEYSRERDEMLYELTRTKEGDGALAIAMKTRLFNAIKNGELVLKDPNSDSTKTISDDGVTIKNGDSSETFEYINPNDIFFFLSNYYIPLQYDDQRLDDLDMKYMHEHNMSEDDMKKFKALSIMARRDHAKKEFKEE